MKLDRLLSILVVLLRKERVQAKELAEMFDVSVRTILRDIDAIDLAGIPIVTYQGVNGGIGIAEGYRLDRSLLTSEDMAEIITTLKGVAGSIPHSRQEIVIGKLENTMEPSQLEKLQNKANQLIIDLSPWGGNEAFKEKIAAIKKAINTHKEIQLIYKDAEGEKTERKIEPYSLVLKGQKWYLYGWCSMREDFRYFKLIRIQELSVLDTIFQPKEAKPQQLYWEDDWKQSNNMIEVELIFQKEVEDIVGDWFQGDAIKSQDGSLMVKTLLPENKGLYGFLLSFGTMVEVINPPHIRSNLGKIAGEVYKKYF
ncbi:Predicted DNA-binding transcriptional regulator YafY, contains an HTH and WYL domains [Natronincola peptidivorans]|uniref:Predicted DNA-binding transcriptional regulator YafY, contains an HTH and WYL domains n=1 Tax=Natronincola peptidivorans TaxID=426128 RepID=A0A1I0CCF2_9FIRM|nr:YafY family protein [Natronincola peptidivorans]SET16614.1 Predicted DNA-binding transcriptional regulator YafY, contains an HTH and WYL domains [Natronincola peptidivorans]